MFLLFLFLLGLAVGSFLNVLIDRLPKGKSILGYSSCDYCKKRVRWNDLIPVVSLIVLKGRCRYCKKKLSWQYPFVELLTGISFVFTWNYFSSLNYGLRITELVIVSCLIVIFFADWKYRIIPDEIQLVFLIASFILFFLHGNHITNLLQRIAEGFFVMLPAFLIYTLTKGKAMGFADVKLSFSIGVLLGLVSGLTALYIGFVSGAIIGGALVLSKKKKMQMHIAFGPFLVLGTMPMVFFDQKIIFFLNQFLGLY